MLEHSIHNTQWIYTQRQKNGETTRLLNQK